MYVWMFVYVFMFVYVHVQMCTHVYIHIYTTVDKGIFSLYYDVYVHLNGVPKVFDFDFFLFFPTWIHKSV